MTDMITPQTAVTAPRKPLRLWPGVTVAVLLVLIRFVLPVVAPQAEFFGLDAPLLSMIGGLAGAGLILVWWLFFSRARWSDRLAVIVVMAVAILATKPLTHVSIQGGMMGLMFFVYAVPSTLGLALVAWAAATRRWRTGPRRAAMVVALALGCGVWMLARTNGIIGSVPDLEWRWTPTAEARLLAQAPVETLPVVRSAPATAEIPATPVTGAEPERTPVPSAPAAEVPPAVLTDGKTPVLSERGITRVEWSGFRGPLRDGIVRGVRIDTDWSASPPAQIWRRPIGPGWSSFAVEGDLIYTQEQRGEHEMVSCYRLSTGEPVWVHNDAVRFYESNGGAGPRGTPTIGNGRVYTVGATGLVNALDARTGAVAWSRNGAADSGVDVPGWGFASSPLVVDDVVIVALSGRLVGYDAATGNPRWLGPEGGGGYSSPHLLTIDGVPQVLLLRGSRTISVAPADGTLLWEHTWLPGASIVQPNLTEDGDVLINTADVMGGQGLRRLAVAKAASGWTVEERWTSRALKPYFNDYVVHEGHAYGFDGSILASMDLADGTRKWKGGRYGQGQMVLLPGQDLLLVLSEEGELALVSATPDKFTEVARVKAVEGKTWNHPVLIGDILLVRNGEEMAAFRMAREPH
ncbi:MAG: PQQ-binding-like beta-propeller repeat protein [Vicinamibacterales bacterium]